MSTLLVDTDVYSYINATNPKRGLPYKPHLDGHHIALSFITVGEIYAGYWKKIGKGEWPDSRLQEFEMRLRLVAIVPYDIEICRHYGELKTRLKNPDGSLRNLGVNDLWIAACAVRHSLKLVTNNRKDFTGIPGLEIISEAP
jgi:predicted nucleic acid-binding protein